VIGDDRHAETITKWLLVVKIDFWELWPEN
jgi:hypothetical protein